jgi:NADH-quinone oxidoreductase subunit L
MGGIVVAVAGIIFFAMKAYSRYQFRDEPATGLSRILEQKWYVDECYEFIISKPLKAFSGFLSSTVEKVVIDGFVNGIGKAVQSSGRQLRLLQSGQVGSYILIMVTVTILFFIIQLFWKS